MKVRKLTAMAVAAVAAVGVVAGGAHASDKAYTHGTGARTIKIKLKGKKPYFSGPKTISRGAKLTIKNTTAISKIGPHTFSLVKKKLIPKTKKQRKACGNGGGVCGPIAAAHEFNPKTMKVSKPTVDVGKTGWDKSFGKKGDTWYTDAKGQTQTRKVSAKVGTTLTYFCAVHPGMVGHIKVVK